MNTLYDISNDFRFPNGTGRDQNVEQPTEARNFSATLLRNKFSPGDFHFLESQHLGLKHPQQQGGSRSPLYPTWPDLNYCKCYLQDIMSNFIAEIIRFCI